jgi:dipeptidyl aminopeptidase/acylaminoacyl peptidase
MREMVIDLRRLLRQKPENPSPAPPRESTGRKASLTAVLSIIATAAIVLATAPYLRKNAPAGAPETRLEIDTPATNDPRSFALSPDGRWLAYVASGDGQSRLWVRRLDSTTAEPLTVTEGGAAYPFWSPDSRSIGFFSGAKLKRIDVGGGSPQTLTDAPSGRGGTWNAEGVILFNPSPSSPLFRVQASGGNAEERIRRAAAVTKLEWSGSHRFPQFLPDGHRFLFYAEGAPDTPGPHSLSATGNGSICLGSLDSGDWKCLTPADTAGLYMPPGWLLWVSGGKLVAGRLDVERRELSGNEEPVTVADSVFFDTSHARLFSVSTTGLVAYRQGAPKLQLNWFDRAGKALGALATPAGNDAWDHSSPRISPDGRRVAVSRRIQDSIDIWLLDGAHANRFTFTGGYGSIWSPDGSQIAFGVSVLSMWQAPQNGKWGFNLKPTDGTRSETQLLDLPLQTSAQLNDWSADGRYLLYQRQDRLGAFNLWVMPLQGDRKPWIFRQTKFDEKFARFSPNGRWVAYESNASGRAEIYVRAFAESAAESARTGEWQVSLAGGLFPAWSHDGKELYWIAPNGQMMAATIATTGTTLQPGAPVALFQTRISGGGLDVNTGGAQFDVAPDGRFLINTVVDNAASPVTLLQNWKSK